MIKKIAINMIFIVSVNLFASANADSATRESNAKSFESSSSRVSIQRERVITNEAEYMEEHNKMEREKASKDSSSNIRLKKKSSKAFSSRPL